MRRTSRKYTKEFKQEAITLALKSSSIANTAKDLGIPEGTLQTWIYTLKKSGNLGAVNTSGAKDMAMLIEENRRLHKELTIAKEEKEILKKAAADSTDHCNTSLNLSAGDRKFNVFLRVFIKLCHPASHFKPKLSRPSK